MIIGATFFIGSLLRWGFQLMEKILKPEEDVELIKEVDKEVEAHFPFQMLFRPLSCLQPNHKFKKQNVLFQVHN